MQELAKLWKNAPEFTKADDKKSEWAFVQPHPRNKESATSMIPLLPGPTQYTDAKTLANSLDTVGDRSAWSKWFRESVCPTLLMQYETAINFFSCLNYARIRAMSSNGMDTAPCFVAL